MQPRSVCTLHTFLSMQIQKFNKLIDPKKLMDKNTKIIDLKIALVSIKGAGKTTLIHRLKKDFNQITVYPTLGLEINRKYIRSDNYNFTFLDYPGNNSVFFNVVVDEADVLVYVIDALYWRESIAAYKECKQSIKNKIKLILINKAEKLGDNEQISSVIIESVNTPILKIYSDQKHIAKTIIPYIKCSFNPTDIDTEQFPEISNNA